MLTVNVDFINNINIQKKHNFFFVLGNVREFITKMNCNWDKITYPTVYDAISELSNHLEYIN